MAKYDWNTFRNYVAFLAGEMASGTMHPHHDSELILWYHDAFLPWDHYLNNIVLFYHDSPITRSHFMDPTDHAIKGFCCIYLQTCQPLRILRNHYAFRVSNTPLCKHVQNVGKLRILRNFGAILPIPHNLQQLSWLAVSRKSPAGQNRQRLVYFTITIGIGVRFRHPINKGSCGGEAMPSET